MSYNAAPRRSKSPCCILAVVILIIVVGLLVAGGVFMYRFATKNVEILNVAGIADPPVNAIPEEVMPEKVGEFDRVALSDNFDLSKGVPNAGTSTDRATSGVVFGLYEDQASNEISVIAVPTNRGDVPKLGGLERFIDQRNHQKSQHAFSLKDNFSGPGEKTIISWSKSNWSYVVQTSSTLGSQFVKDFAPGETTTDDSKTTAAQSDQ